MTVVVTSEFGPTKSFHEFNSWCVENKHHFFPVWLEDMIGYLGPLVIPGESPCFQCIRERMNSHADDPETQDLIHNQADFSGAYPVGFHPAMVSVLGDLAVFELTKFYSSLFSNSILGRLIEVSLLAPRLKSRKIFKLPRCPVCSPLRTSPSMTPKLDVCLEPK
jgi:thiazole/oxazole-forming peptide maturase SagC family component